MQSSKRTLRSHEIPIPQSILSAFGTAVGTGGGSGSGIVSGGCGILNSPPLLETELDLHFSLQYPHFIKRDGNRFLYKYSYLTIHHRRNVKFVHCTDLS